MDRKRTISWVQDEDKIKALVKVQPKRAGAKSLNAGLQASIIMWNKHSWTTSTSSVRSTAAVEKEVMKKVLELKPDALGVFSATATPWKFRTLSGVAVAERPPRASGFNSSTFFMTSFFPQPRCSLRCSLMSSTSACSHRWSKLEVQR